MSGASSGLERMIETGKEEGAVIGDENPGRNTLILVEITPRHENSHTLIGRRRRYSIYLSRRPNTC